MSAAWEYGNGRKTDGGHWSADIPAASGTATDVPADGAAELSATDGAARLSTSDGYSASCKNQM